VDADARREAVVRCHETRFPSDIAIMSAHFILHGPHSLADLVSRRLSSERFWWSRDVEAHVEHDEVRLTGRVRSYYQKQVAQESLRGLQGLRRIRNELCVVR
jgi:hypothetical protein